MLTLLFNLAAPLMTIELVTSGLLALDLGSDEGRDGAVGAAAGGGVGPLGAVTGRCEAELLTATNCSRRLASTLECGPNVLHSQRTHCTFRLALSRTSGRLNLGITLSVHGQRSGFA